MIILAIFTSLYLSEPFDKIGKFKPIFDNRQKFEIIRK